MGQLVINRDCTHTPLRIWFGSCCNIASHSWMPSRIEPLTLKRCERDQTPRLSASSSKRVRNPRFSRASFEPPRIRLHTCLCLFPRRHYLGDQNGRDSLEHMLCLRCNRELEPGQKSVAIYLFAQTVGVKPRQKSAAQRICFCPQCSVSLAMGPPPEGALNVAAWQMIRDIVGSDPALTEAAWENLRGITGLLQATGTDGNPARPGSYFEF